MSENKNEAGYWGVAAYIGPLCFLTRFAKKDSPAAQFHAGQGMVLFAAEVILAVFVLVLSPLTRPVLPLYMAVRCIHAFGTMLLLTFMVMGIMHALREETLPLPLVGRFVRRPEEKE